jgi:hypothetical protein
MSRYTTIEEVTAVAQTVVKSSDNYDRNVWRHWVFLATLELGIADDEIKVCEIIPNNGIGKLPDDCRHIIELSLADTAGAQMVHKFRTGKNRIYANNQLLETATTNGSPSQFVPVDVSHDAYNIHLGTNGENVGRIIIRYFAYPLDINNVPMVREEDVMACVYFIRYMQALRDDENRSKIEQDQVNWFREADRAKARKKMASMNPDKARSVMNSLMKVVTPFTSIQNY